jgi:hypothetical protein
MMYDYTIEQKPSKLVPVLIGAGAMTATSVIPGINFINCLCCAGIMGGAVLGVYFYKKSFPDNLPFRTSDGAIIGVFSGLLAAVMTAVIETFSMGVLGAGLSEEMQDEIEDAFDQAITQGSDPAAVEAVQQFVMTMLASPLLLFAVILLSSLFIFAAFGALGGVIGGSIFKTKTVEQAPPH